jgi:hypothetical protein
VHAIILVPSHLFQSLFPSIITTLFLPLNLLSRNRLPRKAALPLPNPLCQILRQIHSFQLTLSKRRRAPFAPQPGAIGGDFDLRALDEVEHGLEVAGHGGDGALGGLGGFRVAVEQGVFLAFAPAAAAFAGAVAVAVGGSVSVGGYGGGWGEVGCGGGVAVGVAVGERVLVAAAGVAVVGALLAVWTCHAVAGGCGSFAAVLGVLVVAEALNLTTSALLV